VRRPRRSAPDGEHHRAGSVGDRRWCRNGRYAILRPLLIVDLVGAAPFAAVSAHMQRATTLAPAGAPFALGAGVAAFGWRSTWIVAIGAFAIAAERYHRLGAAQRKTGPLLDGRDLRPAEATGI
jgi:hypothetical protein